MNATYLRLEILRVLRVPQLLLFTVALPVALFLIFSTLFADTVFDGVSGPAYTMQSWRPTARWVPRCSRPPRSPSNGASAGTGSSG